MASVFGYGHMTETSAASKSTFNDIKNNIFRHKIYQFVQINLYTLQLGAGNFAENELWQTAEVGLWHKM